MPEATLNKRTTVGVRELKNQLSSYLDRVKAGEEVIVTQHGTPVARLSAVGAEVALRQILIEEGIIAPARDTKRHLPKETVNLAPGVSVAELVARERG